MKCGLGIENVKLKCNFISCTIIPSTSSFTKVSSFTKIRIHVHMFNNPLQAIFGIYLAYRMYLHIEWYLFGQEHICRTSFNKLYFNILQNEIFSSLKWTMTWFWYIFNITSLSVAQHLFMLSHFGNCFTFNVIEFMQLDFSSLAY